MDHFIFSTILWILLYSKNVRKPTKTYLNILKGNIIKNIYTDMKLSIVMNLTVLHISIKTSIGMLITWIYHGIKTKALIIHAVIVENIVATPKLWIALLSVLFFLYINDEVITSTIPINKSPNSPTNPDSDPIKIIFPIKRIITEIIPKRGPNIYPTIIHGSSENWNSRNSGNIPISLIFPNKYKIMLIVDITAVVHIFFMVNIFFFI